MAIAATIKTKNFEFISLVLICLSNEVDVYYFVFNLINVPP